MKADSFILKYNLIIIISSAVIFYLTLEYLIKKGYSPSSVMFYRGILSFSLTFLLSMNSKQIIIPKNLRLQFFRIVISGIGLLLVFESYKYLEASTVSLISRLDIPFAVLIGFFLKQRKKDFKVILSLLAFCLILSIYFFAKHIGEGSFGLTLSIVSILLVSGSYILAKRSTKEENNLVVINTVNVGSIIIGLISGAIIGDLHVIKMADLWILLLASLSQISLNYSLSVIYRHKEVEEGQRPLLISVLILLFAEQVIHQRVFDLHHSLIIILVFLVIYMITLKNLPWMPLKKKISNQHHPSLGVANDGWIDR